MTIHQMVPLFALALNILLLGSALMGDRKNQRAYVFALVVAAMSLWNFGVFGLRGATEPATALAWERVLHVGVVAIPILFYHYVLALLDLPSHHLRSAARVSDAPLRSTASTTSDVMTEHVAPPQTGGGAAFSC